jgi:ATPase subunit of ABC transporter with duplicated ATPase domains
VADESRPDPGRARQSEPERPASGPTADTALDPDDRVLQSVERLRRQTQLATGREVSASALLEGFGLTGDKLVTRVGDLSGGEKRRLQFLRLLLTEPNVLLLDEPTNDLDIDTLQVIEDYLDSWPGTLLVVSHDRYFLERVCDTTYALLGDGSCVLLPGGVDEYLSRRAASRRSTSQAARQPASRAVRRTAEQSARSVKAGPTGSSPSTSSPTAQKRQQKKELARIESQLAKLSAQIAELHAQAAANATDYQALIAIQQQLAAANATQETLENRWLELAD